MKTRFYSIIIPIIILILGILLFSIGRNNPQQTETLDVDALRTEAVATYAFSLTETMVAVPIVFPTLTIEPTTSIPDFTATLGTPAKADPCYNLLWLKDMTIPDGQQMNANEVFTKTWLVQNIGGCAWAPGFKFTHVGGDRMGGATVIIKEPIPVGAKREVSVQLTVPSGQNGLIQSSWQMTDADGNFFGDPLSVNIVVGNITTPTVTKSP